MNRRKWFRVVTESAQASLAASPAAVWLVRKVANQCDAVLKYHYGARLGSVAASGERLLLRCLRDRVSTFVDVGANRGDWTRALLAETRADQARGLLVEPDPDLATALRREFPGHPQQIEVVQAAAGNVAGKTVFFRDPHFSACSSILRDAEGLERIVVPLTTVDEEIERRGWPEISILKIDAEGFDAAVLGGAEQLLQAGRVGIVQFEYGALWRDHGSTLTAVLTRLEKVGMETFFLTADGFWRIARSRFREFFGYANVVAVRADFMEPIRGSIRGEK